MADVRDAPISHRSIALVLLVVPVVCALAWAAVARLQRGDAAATPHQLAGRCRAAATLLLNHERYEEAARVARGCDRSLEQLVYAIGSYPSDDLERTAAVIEPFARSGKVPGYDAWRRQSAAPPPSDDILMTKMPPGRIARRQRSTAPLPASFRSMNVHSPRPSRAAPYLEALETARRTGDAAPLARALELAWPWDSYDVPVVWPALTKNRAALVQHMIWRDSPLADARVMLKYPWKWAVYAALRRAAFTAVGATDEAARWDAIYRRFDAVLSDRKKLVALILASG